MQFIYFLSLFAFAKKYYISATIGGFANTQFPPISHSYKNQKRQYIFLKRIASFILHQTSRFSFQALPRRRRASCLALADPLQSGLAFGVYLSSKICVPPSKPPAKRPQKNERVPRFSGLKKFVLLAQQNKNKIFSSTKDAKAKSIP